MSSVSALTRNGRGLAELMVLGGKPARSTVESRLMIPAKVEIDVVAYRPLP